MTPRRAPWSWGRPERKPTASAGGTSAPGTTRDPVPAGETSAAPRARDPAEETTAPHAEGSPADAAPAETPAAGHPGTPDEAGSRAPDAGGSADPGTGADGTPAPRRTHADYTGGVYGSMLAASVIVGAGTLGSFPRLELVLLLLLTGVVFWIAHVHAHLFGARLAQRPPDLAVVRRVCRQEWTIVKAAVPPAVAVGVGPVLGLDVQGGQWLALSVAVTGQVGWSVAAARQAGAPGRLLVLSALVNLVLGLIILASKLWLKH
ncbi:hypothetical protein SUDANB13_01218 [Streptomyces sp. enrichment culture]